MKTRIEEKIMDIKDIKFDGIIQILASICRDDSCRIAFRTGYLRSHYVIYITLMDKHRIVCDILSTEEDREVFFGEHYIKEVKIDERFEELMKYLKKERYKTNLQ